MDIALLAVNVLLLSVIAWQAWEARRQAEGARAQAVAVREQTAADHERRKKQATIEYYSNLRSSRRELQAEVEHKFGHDALAASEVVLLLDQEERGEPTAIEVIRLIKAYFTGLESLAAGVNLEVFDYQTLRRLGGAHIRTVFRQYRAFVDVSRQRKSQDTLYVELELLHDRLSQERPVEERGVIEHS